MDPTETRVVDRPAKAAKSAAQITVTVTVTVDGKVHDGQGGKYPAGAVISVTPEQAAGLRRQGFAK